MRLHLSFIQQYSLSDNCKSSFLLPQLEQILLLGYHLSLATDKYQDIMENVLTSTPQHVWQSTVDNLLFWDEKKLK